MTMIQTVNGAIPVLGTTTIGTQFPKVNVDNFHYDGGGMTVGNFNYDGEGNAETVNAELDALTTTLDQIKADLEKATADYDAKLKQWQESKQVVDQMKYQLDNATNLMRPVFQKAYDKAIQVHSTNTTLLEDAQKRKVALTQKLSTEQEKLNDLIVQMEQMETSQVLETTRAEAQVKALEIQASQVAQASDPNIIEAGVKSEKIKTNRTYAIIGGIVIVVLGYLVLRNKK